MYYTRIKFVRTCHNSSMDTQKKKNTIYNKIINPTRAQHIRTTSTYVATVFRQREHWLCSSVP